LEQCKLDDKMWEFVENKERIKPEKNIRGLPSSTYIIKRHRLTIVWLA